MSMFCTGLLLSIGQSNTLVSVGLGRVDQEFGARRMQVKDKGAAREGEQLQAQLQQVKQNGEGEKAEGCAREGEQQEPAQQRAQCALHGSCSCQALKQRVQGHGGPIPLGHE